MSEAQRTALLIGSVLLLTIAVVIATALSLLIGSRSVFGVPLPFAYADLDRLTSEIELESWGPPSCDARYLTGAWNGDARRDVLLVGATYDSDLNAHLRHGWFEPSGWSADPVLPGSGDYINWYRNHDGVSAQAFVQVVSKGQKVHVGDEVCRAEGDGLLVAITVN